MARHARLHDRRSRLDQRPPSRLVSICRRQPPQHTVNAFGDVPDLRYRILSEVSSLRSHIDEEVAATKVRDLQAAHAHHLIVEAVKANVVPASRLPKVIEALESVTEESRNVHPLSVLFVINVPLGQRASILLCWRSGNAGGRPETRPSPQNERIALSTQEPLCLELPDQRAEVLRGNRD